MNMSQQSVTGLKRFQVAYQTVEQLAQHGRYLAAFVFGSFARGEATEHSDLDVQVIVDEDNMCTNINHPIIAGVKLDLTFLSLRQLRERTEREIAQRERVPMIAESIIVFDKTRELTQLQAQARQVLPEPVPPEEHQFLQFMFFHGNDKAQRHLDSDPLTALLVMHVGVNDWLHFHYRLQQRWWVSSKRLLADLRQWDAPLARLVEQFVATSEVHAKFANWSAIIDYIARPLGGRQPIAENNCACATCCHDLAMLLGETT